MTIRRSGSSFSEVDRVGKMLAGHGLRILGQVSTSEEVRVGACCSSISLNFRDFPTVEDARREIGALRSRIGSSGDADGKLAKKLKKAIGTYALAEKSDYIRNFLGESVTTQLQVFTINDDLLLGIPAELFVEYGLKLQEYMDSGLVFPIGYCNDMVGYVVTPEAAEEGGYEAGSTLLDDKAGTRILDGLRSMGRR
ncbi:MAG: hypothetical protein HXS50_01785 [Theionarchaea archaeon]|nr:hypothetical protein [Theionarchaea archaeon]